MSRLTAFAWRGSVAAAAAAIVTCACLAGASAQPVAYDASVAIEQRLAAAERALDAMALQLPGQLSGPVPQAGVQLVQLPSDYAPQVELRLSQIEQRIQAMTGQIEELQYHAVQMNDRLERAVNDIDYRLSSLEGGAPQASAQAGWTSPDAVPAQGAQGGTTLGTVVVRPPEAASGAQVASVTPPRPAQQTQQAPVQQASALPAGDVAQQYNYAYSLLQQANYPAAEQALRQFVQQNPTDPLASNALYWLGETYYARSQFNDAAVSFAQAYQQYPTGAKAVDSLLKLGMSLGAMGQTADACLTFAQLRSNYASAPTAILNRATQERERLQCR